jgi:hypothetical protein
MRHRFLHTVIGTSVYVLVTAGYIVALSSVI